MPPLRRSSRSCCVAAASVGDLQEQLLEVGGGGRVARDRDLRADGGGKQLPRRRPRRHGSRSRSGRCRSVAAVATSGWRLEPGPGSSRSPPRRRAREPGAPRRCAASGRSRDRARRRGRGRVDDRDRGAQLLELGEDVAADHDRLAEAAKLAEELAQLDAGARIEAGGGLVEQEHLGIVDERVGEAEALLHAAGEAEDVGVALRARGRPARAGRRSCRFRGPARGRSSDRRSRGTPRPSCRRRPRRRPACSR